MFLEISEEITVLMNNWNILLIEHFKGLQNQIFYILVWKETNSCQCKKKHNLNNPVVFPLQNCCRLGAFVVQAQ